MDAFCLVHSVDAYFKTTLCKALGQASGKEVKRNKEAECLAGQDNSCTVLGCRPSLSLGFHTRLGNAFPFSSGPSPLSLSLGDMASKSLPALFQVWSGHFLCLHSCAKDPGQDISVATGSASYFFLRKTR